MYKNRLEAGKLLAAQLQAYKGKGPLVLAIPRGAVPMAKIIAEALEGELNVVLVHKIPAAYNEEVAIGAIGLSGQLQEMPYAEAIAEKTYLQEEGKRQLTKLKARQKYYGLKDPSYLDRLVIIVDDGIATGATVLSAIREVKIHQPKRIIVAAAVTSKEAAEKIREQADELITLEELESFLAVGEFFENFDQVSDEEVITLLRE